MSIAPETRARLAGISTATLQTQLFKRGLRSTFLYGLRPLNPAAASFVAEAFTLRYIPAREDLDVIAGFNDPEHPQRKAIESVPAGQALVMDSRGDGRAASCGQILATRLQVRGVAAIVTDGSVRDSGEIAKMSLPVYTQSVSATINLVAHHAVDFQVPIACAGVAVYPGDVLVGDAEGIVAIPRELADEVARDGAEQEALEEFVLHRVQGGAPLPGTYPPGPDVVAAFEERRGAERGV
jgi:regulator of RNase E activity RraA